MKITYCRVLPIKEKRTRYTSIKPPFTTCLIQTFSYINNLYIHNTKYIYNTLCISIRLFVFDYSGKAWFTHMYSLYIHDPHTHQMFTSEILHILEDTPSSLPARFEQLILESKQTQSLRQNISCCQRGQQQIHWLPTKNTLWKGLEFSIINCVCFLLLSQL